MTKFKVFQIETIEELQFIASVLTNHTNYVFRGLKDETYKLNSTLERVNQDNTEEHPSDLIQSEMKIARQLQALKHLYPEIAYLGSNNLFQLFSTFRHHGGPTRLVDVTPSFPLAVFHSLPNKHSKSNSVVWAFDVNDINVSFVEFLNSDERSSFENEFNESFSQFDSKSYNDCDVKSYSPLLLHNGMLFFWKVIRDHIYGNRLGGFKYQVQLVG